MNCKKKFWWFSFMFTFFDVGHMKFIFIAWITSFISSIPALPPTKLERKWDRRMFVQITGSSYRWKHPCCGVLRFPFQWVPHPLPPCSRNLNSWNSNSCNPTHNFPLGQNLDGWVHKQGLKTPKKINHTKPKWKCESCLSRVSNCTDKTWYRQQACSSPYTTQSSCANHTQTEPTGKRRGTHELVFWS